MKNRLLALFVFLALMGGSAAAQDAKTVLQAADKAMGATNLKSVQYSGTTGYVGALGQSYGAEMVGSAETEWPKFDITSYTRTIDYETKSSKEEIVLVQGKNPPLGGGGTPLQGEQRRTSMVSGNYAWNMQGSNVTPAPAAAELRQLYIMLTPHGFVRAALAGNPTAVTRMEAGRKVTIVSFTALGKYRVNGTINGQNLVQYIQTWVPNAVLGDMVWETRYSNFKDFGGVQFPMVIHEHQGHAFYSLPARDTFEVTLSNVKTNVSNAALTVPEEVRQATVQPVRVESQKLADGVWFLGGGTHNSVAVEFRDFVAVVEAPQNEERSLAVIAEVKKIIPNKPISYLVNTHHHFDHTGGMRTYAAEGATIITQAENRDYYDKVVFAQPARSLVPDRLSLAPRVDRFRIIIEAVTQNYVLSDGVRTMELFPIGGLDHTRGMMIAYLPKEKIVVEADLYSPPAPGQAPATPGPSAISLYNNIKRRKLDVAQIAPIHGRVGTMDEFEKLVGPAIASQRGGAD